MKAFNLITSAIFTILISHNAFGLIFDNGSRRAHVGEAPEKIRWASKSVVSVFSPTGFIQQDSGDYLVKKFQMNSVPNSPRTDALRMLCETELYSRDFRSESLKGSGILITPDQVLVPAHLFKRATDCKERKVVFNYNGNSDIIPHEDVYNCIKREIIRYDIYPEFRPAGHDFGTSKLDGHMDYAIIRLDRPVKDIEPARVNDNHELLKANDHLYFVSSMRGLPQTVERAEIKYVSKAVVSTNASTAQGSSGGIYFNEDGLFIGMHISSNPASNAVDDESNCLKWVQESTETFNWDTLVHIKERGVERPFGALMLPTTSLHQKLFALQKIYFEKQALIAQEEALKQQVEASKNPVANEAATPLIKAVNTQPPQQMEHVPSTTPIAITNNVLAESQAQLLEAADAEIQAASATNTTATDENASIIKPTSAEGQTTTDNSASSKTTTLIPSDSATAALQQNAQKALEEDSQKSAKADMATGSAKLSNEKAVTDTTTSSTTIAPVNTESKEENTKGEHSKEKVEMADSKAPEAAKEVKQAGKKAKNQNATSATQKNTVTE